MLVEYAKVKSTDNRVDSVIIFQDTDSLEMIQEFMGEEFTPVKVTEETGLAIIGLLWFPETEKFQPYPSYPSWVWNSEYEAWVAPVSVRQVAGTEDVGAPDEWTWDEDNQTWVRVD